MSLNLSDCAVHNLMDLLLGFCLLMNNTFDVFLYAAGLFGLTRKVVKLVQKLGQLLSVVSRRTGPTLITSVLRRGQTPKEHKEGNLSGVLVIYGSTRPGIVSKLIHSSPSSKWSLRTEGRPDIDEARK
ncbi:hypothetical protein BDB01DRAFT_900035 [Pilobolus umbonatus]|nr:hypothetical protein BDB01DRAFT_900035 [Pilobolus umbonatus]